MEKKCLVFMPLGDPSGYPAGHFARIFDYIIVPACKLADMSPIRVDEQPVMLKSAIDIDMVLCDLSASSSDVLYGFAVRQGLQLPVTLMKDQKTSVDFSQREFNIVEYDESLRIDMVQKAIEVLSEVLKTAYANRVEDSLVRRLNIGQGTGTSSFGNSFVSSYTMETEKAPEPEIVSAPFVPLPDFVGDPITDRDIEKLKAGDVLYHITYGKGAIVSIKPMKMANIQFDGGIKLLVLGTSGIFRKVIG
jgi:uncharacterized protein YeeX (DUF496 family)